MQLVTRPQRRGAEVFALELSRHLEERGHATRVVHLYAPGSAAAPLTVRPQDRPLDGDATSPLERLPGWQPHLLRRLLTAIDDFEPDVVQANGSRTVKYGSLARRWRRKSPWALVYRSIGTPGDWLRGPVHRALYRRLVIARVDGVVAVSRATRASLESAYRPLVPLPVIPRGIDLERFASRLPRSEVRRRLGTPEQRPVMIYVGSLSAEKRPDRLLRIAAAAAEGRSDAELWVVGDGPLRPATERQAANLVTALRIRFLGSRNDVADLLGAADLLLLVSDTEGSPGVVLEAGAAGLPVAALAVGGVGELVEDGVTGLLAPPGDEPSMVSAVRSLLADPQRRQTLGAAGQRRVEAAFSLERIADRLLAHYRTVLAIRRGKT